MEEQPYGQLRRLVKGLQSIRLCLDHQCYPASRLIGALLLLTTIKRRKRPNLYDRAWNTDTVSRLFQDLLHARFALNSPQ